LKNSFESKHKKSRDKDFISFFLAGDLKFHGKQFCGDFFDKSRMTLAKD
jgi:hypothetical protein